MFLWRLDQEELITRRKSKSMSFVWTGNHNLGIGFFYLWITNQILPLNISSSFRWHVLLISICRLYIYFHVERIIFYWHFTIFYYLLLYRNKALMESYLQPFFTTVTTLQLFFFWKKDYFNETVITFPLIFYYANFLLDVNYTNL